jgi:hypothetical protein
LRDYDERWNVLDLVKQVNIFTKKTSLPRKTGSLLMGCSGMKCVCLAAGIAAEVKFLKAEIIPRCFSFLHFNLSFYKSGTFKLKK